MPGNAPCAAPPGGGHSPQRAARLVDMMELRGVVGGYQGSKPREVLISQEEAEELLAEEEETVG